MNRRLLPSCTLAAALVAALSLPVAAFADLPSGERVLGKVVLEPAYDYNTGGLVFLATPMGTPFPSKANGHAVAPIYLVVYPPGTAGTFSCMGTQPGNCPDHDAFIAQTAVQIASQFPEDPYGSDWTVVPGHDHLVGAASTGGDFNVAWEIHLVLFTSAAAVHHITTLADLQDSITSGAVTDVDSGNAFNCSIVSPIVYYRAAPWR